MNDYSELLKDPRWQKKRLEILNRDGWKCRECANNIDSGVTFHVHHFGYTYGKLPWEYDDDVLVTLCEHCHSLEENLRKESLLKPISSSAKITCIELFETMAGVAYMKHSHPEHYQAVKAILDKVCRTDNRDAFYKFIQNNVK